MTICPACTEEFIPSEKDEELCTECEYEMEKGLTKILLGKDDCAFVFRKDSLPEIFLAQGNDSNKEMSILIGLALSLDNKEFVEKIINEASDPDINFKIIK
jgi:hypothetical protein